MKNGFMLGFILLFLAAFAFAGGGSESSSGSDEMIEMSVSLNGPPNLFDSRTWAKAVDYINANSDGRLNIKIYHSGTLGGQDTKEFDLQQGLFDFCHLPPSSMASLYEPIGVLSAPFLFRDSEHMLNALHSEIGQNMFSSFEEETGIKILGVWYWGIRHLSSNTKGITPEELSSVKMRIYNSPVTFAWADALGTKATPINFNELYLALKTGTVDAQENPIPTVLVQKFYEVQDYLILTGHSVESIMPVVNEDSWNALPADLQELVVEGINVATEWMVNERLAEEESAKAELINLGMEIIDIPDKTPFLERAEAVYEEYEDVWGAGVVDKIQAIQ